MRVDAKTKVHDLCEHYPYMLDWLAEYNPEFGKLKNPVLYNTMARVASLETAASLGSIPVDTFLDDVRQAIAQREIVAQETAGAKPRLTEEARAQRQEVLKDIIRELHDGAPVDKVKARFDELIRDVDAAEVAMMEQALIAEGLPVEEVQRLCDVHVTVFKESLEDKTEIEVPEDHPVAAYRRENQVIADITGALRCNLDALTGALTDEARREAVGDISAQLERLAQLDVHYARKENQLFPVLERHGVEGPTKVMWALDDDIRARVKVDRAHASRSDAASLATSLPETLQMVDDMVYKEEKILFPTSLQVITAEEWAEIADGDADIGYAWIEGPSGDRAREAAAAWAPESGALLLPLTTGALSPDQVDLILRNLPFDITYVDADDRVRYYSEGDRVFHRTPAAIGREVRNCHPPASVDKVEAILSEFRAGTKDVAEFWIDFKEKFVHIRYFALRDAGGTYQGCLEVVQDATHVRGLTGERRIVDW
jgi:DUF438 domain-containing protein